MAESEKENELALENQSLREENRELRIEIATALFRIQEQDAIEKRFEESQSRFETIFYKSMMGNKIIAPDLRIMQINEVFREMLGYPEEEIIGTKIIAFAHPDFIHHWHHLQENLWTKKIPSFQIETCLIRKDGTVFWCQVTSIVFRDNDTTLGYTIVQDISKRKELELNLKNLNDSQETIMQMVAHDLKNPLFNIKVLAGFLKDSLENPKAEAIAREENINFTRLITDTCDKTFVIVDDLLHIGELKVKEVFAKTDYEIFIGTQLILLGVEARKKNIKVVFDHPEEPLYVPLNQEKFARVFENLFSNALKFTGSGGQIRITLQEEEEDALLCIADTGIGIPAHLQDTVFNKFTDATRSGTAGENTSGLGLYIVKQIVDLHQGKIWVESREQEGTSFFVRLKKCPARN